MDFFEPSAKPWEEDLKEIRVRLVATRSREGEWEYNPSRSRTITPGMVLIFLGSPSDSRTLCEQLGGEMIASPLDA